MNPRLPMIQERARYLPAQDKYLFAVNRPAYKFNVIGVGMNGQEHMKVTMLEGRAAIHGVFDPNPGSLEAARRIHAQLAPSESLVIYDSLAAACPPTPPPPRKASGPLWWAQPPKNRSKPGRW